MSELPEGWHQCELREIGQIVTGNTPSRSDSDNYGNKYPWVKPPDLGFEIPITSTIEQLSEKGARQARLLPAGATLVSCIGILGKVGLAGTTLATNQQINSVIFDELIVSQKYGFYFCRTLKTWLDENSSSTTLAIINKGRFSQAPFLLPPINEQLRIVTKLEAVFAKLATVEHRLDKVQRVIGRLEVATKLEKLKQSILAKAFCGELVPQDPSDEPASVLLERIRASRNGTLPRIADRKRP